MHIISRNRNPKRAIGHSDSHAHASSRAGEERSRYSRTWHIRTHHHGSWRPMSSSNVLPIGTALTRANARAAASSTAAANRTPNRGYWTFMVTIKLTRGVAVGVER